MSHMSAIGFGASSPDEFREVVSRALDRAAPPPELGASAARYLKYRDPSGAAIAARVDATNSIECMTPFFDAPDGGTRWRIRTDAPLADAECVHCSGAEGEVLDPSSGEMCTRTALQFLYFQPYAAWLEQERTYDVVVVAFADALSLHTTAEQFYQAQATLFGRDSGGPEAGPLRLTPHAFMPHGLFGAADDVGARARALITGTVESVATPTNTLTGGAFVHVRVRTLTGAVDIVAAADAVELPAAPTLAIADAWLVARPVAAPPPEAKPTWRQRFGLG